MLNYVKQCTIIGSHCSKYSIKMSTKNKNVKTNFRHPLGSLAAPQTPLLSRGASPPGPPDLNFSKHDPQMTPKSSLIDLQMLPK